MKHFLNESHGISLIQSIIIMDRATHCTINYVQRSVYKPSVLNFWSNEIAPKCQHVINSRLMFKNNNYLLLVSDIALAMLIPSSCEMVICQACAF